MFEQFLYVSSLSRECALTDVVRIVSSSRRNNAREGITGLLLFDGKSFCQYLEGEAAALAGLKKKILADIRHHYIRVLLEGRASARKFDGWRIGFAYSDVTHALNSLVGLKGDAALAELMRIREMPEFEYL